MECNELIVECDYIELVVSAEEYELIMYDGDYSPAEDIWQKHTVYVDPDTVTLQNDLFAGEVADIIYIDGQSFLWANNGTSLGAVTKTGDTFDFSGYGEGAIGGWLTFEYRRLP